MGQDLSIAEENYLKAIYLATLESSSLVSTNDLAGRMGTTAASVTDMLKRLSKKLLINYRRYYGVGLTASGRRVGAELTRRHRLWEVFLVDKLSLDWVEVHEMAEQLEHVSSAVLIDRLDAYLGYPQFDPHGEPIPQSDGELPRFDFLSLDQMDQGDCFVFRAVGNTDASFLHYLTRQGLSIGCEMELVDKDKYSGAMRICLTGSEKEFVITERIAADIFVQKVK